MATTAADVPDRHPPPVLVGLGVRGAHADAVSRHLEALTGVEIATAGGPPAEVAVVDEASSTDPDGPPAVLLVTDAAAPVEAATAALRQRPAAVLRWPRQRDELMVRLREAARSAPSAPATPELRIGGAAGGVGTSTVALALAGLAAWGGRRTLVLGAGWMPAPEGEVLAPGALTGHRTWAAATVLPGVSGLRLLRTARPPAGVPLNAPEADLVVRDVGAGRRCDVLVLRRDRAGLEALDTAAVAAAVIVDDGPAPRRMVAAAATPRPTIAVARSARVARAGFHRRVPGGLPGRWLARLAPVVDGLDDRPDRLLVHSLGEVDTAASDARP